jgi:threonine synthase
MQMPVFSKKDILKLSGNNFGQNAAEILNLFFGTNISGWDVDVAIGRRFFSAKEAGRKTIMGRLWDDVHGSFISVVRSLAQLVSPQLDNEAPVGNWLEIGIRVSVVFALFGELLSAGQISYDKGIDVAIATGSFAMPMALWYSRQMGLPIRNILCGCNENGVIWDLLHRGEADMGALSVKTTTPEADFAVPPNLERLIYGTLGCDEVLRYLQCCRESEDYVLTEADTALVSRGMFAAVVSMERVATIIPSVYATNRYILDPYGALAYGALSDYRARTGAVGTAVVLSEVSPRCESALVSDYMHISPEELSGLMNED